VQETCGAGSGGLRLERKRWRAGEASAQAEGEGVAVVAATWRVGSIDSTLPSPNASLLISSGLERTKDSASKLDVVSPFFDLSPH
jgi:hypothetical protein